MVSARENPNIDDMEKPQPFRIQAVPPCYQDLKTYRQTKFKCIMCDFFEECKIAAQSKI
jgi:hypothetical protein